MIAPTGLDGIEATFGRFAYRPLAGVDIDVDDGWEQDNLVRLRNVGGTGHDIRLHWRVAASFEEAFLAARAACPDYPIRLLGGYCPRMKKLLTPRPNPPLSTHAWGIAFDVNWDTNQFARVLVSDLPRAWIAAFVDRGWEWGGTWRKTKDAMHFQMARDF